MVIKKLKGYKYLSLEEEHCEVELPDFEHEFMNVRDGYLTVKGNYAFDGPSGPTKDDETNMIPACFHDALCQAMREGLLDRKYKKYVDKLFHEHLLYYGMWKFRAKLYYWGVRLRKKQVYPEKNPRGQKYELKHSGVWGEKPKRTKVA